MALSDGFLCGAGNAPRLGNEGLVWCLFLKLFDPFVAALRSG